MTGVAGFPAFFRALWGYDPFSWQRRLAERVANEGWPSLLDIPTGCGKTAALDIALYDLAREAARADRRAPLRIVYVVDRRLVVDAAWRRARRIADALACATGGPLAETAAVLRALAGDGPPLRIARLRGGMPLDPDWVRTPHQPTILLSTVDQAGSRLLFRGYGVSSSMLPVHAGLLGNDVLWLVDEAHLSQPFLETLEAVARERRRGEAELDPPFAFCRLTATAGQDSGQAFGLGKDDREHPILRERLGASKPARLREVGGGEEAFRAAFAEEATAFLEAGRRRIALVVNRVLRARAILERLTAEVGEGAEVLLAIGRARPLERDALAQELEVRLGPEAGDGERPLILVATQTIEVGADFDFDALVSELAPLDALCQRFGRLDRWGRHGTAPAVVLAHEVALAKGARDPVYGDAPKVTWKWLRDRAAGKKKAHPIFDFGIDAFREHDAAVTPESLSPRADAPFFFPAYAEALARTSPRPAAEPEIALFLHGPDAGPVEVRLVWRADLCKADLRDPARAAEIVAALPPSSLEALELPLSAVRRWLAGEPMEVADLEGTADGADEHGAGGRTALRWAGPEDDATTIITAEDLRPGDTLVVPAGYGGCDRFGWNPETTGPVRDLAEEAAERQRGRLVLRLHAELAIDWIGEEDTVTAAEAWRMVREEIALLDEPEATELIDNLLDLEDLPSRLRARLLRLRKHAPELRLLYGEDPTRGILLYGRERLSAGEAVSENDALSLSASRSIGLWEHLDHVRGKVELFAARLALSEELTSVLTTAARMHDLGKAEPRFQIYLRGGDRLAARLGPVLAKSERFLHPKRAAALAGLPPGIRHESWSVATAARLLEGETEPFRDLVLWLIGTHHGRGRPFFPPIVDPGAEDFTLLCDGHEIRVPGDPGLHRLDSFWFDLHERLHRRFGPWRLAWLEAILRLADHRASEEEAS